MNEKEFIKFMQKLDYKSIEVDKTHNIITIYLNEVIHLAIDRADGYMCLDCDSIDIQCNDSKNAFFDSKTVLFYLYDDGVLETKIGDILNIKFV